jgi:elongation factor Tu
MAFSGDNVRLEMTLDKPIAVESGNRFALREGSRTIGRVVVTSIQWADSVGLTPLFG